MRLSPRLARVLRGIADKLAREPEKPPTRDYRLQIRAKVEKGAKIRLHDTWSRSAKELTVREVKAWGVIAQTDDGVFYRIDFTEIEAVL